eukprot:scaffold192128_cov38-Prasinocladus_malaysianus.AAC.2
MYGIGRANASGTRSWQTHGANTSRLSAVAVVAGKWDGLAALCKSNGCEREADELWLLVLLEQPYLSEPGGAEYEYASAVKRAA